MNEFMPGHLNLSEASMVRRIEHDIILPLVKEVRQNLEITHDMQEHPNFTGLDNKASAMLVERLTSSEELKKTQIFDLEIVMVHGEINHKPFIPSRYWAMRHTWVEVGMNFEAKNLEYRRVRDVYIYIDCTSQQFKHMFEDIPDFYISALTPHWFYPDRDNWVYKEDSFKWLNENIKIPIKKKDNRYCDDVIGLLEYCQYEIWGRISDWLGKNNILTNWTI